MNVNETIGQGVGQILLSATVGFVAFLVRSYVKTVVSEVRLLRRQMGKVLQRMVRHDMRLRILEGRGVPDDVVRERIHLPGSSGDVAGGGP